MKKIVVTGANGFIGRHCLPLLVQQGYEVHAISSKGTPSEVEGVQMHRLDLLGFNQIDDFLRRLRPTHLLHLAWVTEPGAFWNSPDNIRWVEASLCLVHKFKDYGGKRAVMAGTCAEYDWAYNPCSEFETPLHPATLYGRSKKDVFAGMANIGLSWAWGRLFQLYGPYEHPKKLISSTILSLLKGKQALCTHGNQIRDFLYIEDVASAFTALLDSSLQGPVNIASGSPTTLKSLCLKIGEKMGGADHIVFGAVPAPSGEPPILTADVKRLYNELQWKPSFDLNDGLEKSIQWWKESSGALI